MHSYPPYPPPSEAAVVDLVFGTSHGYVSPSVYHRTPSAPTLDYATVHAQAEVTLLDNRDRRMRVVHATIAALEGQRPEQWDPHHSQELFDRIIDRVGAFTVRITTYDAMFKLSQDLPEDVRGRVRDDFRAGPREHPDLADLMESMESAERMEQAR